MDLKNKFLNLCTPAQVYFVLALLSCIIALFNKFDFIGIIMKLLFAIIWTMILNYICRSGYVGVSWFLVVLPYIILLLLLAGLVKSSKR